MTINSEAQMIAKYMEMIKLLNIYLNHWPRHEKYALANRVRNSAYEMFDLITEAQKRYHKKTTLVNLDISHERLRMQLYLANELGYFAFKKGKKDNKSSPVKRYLSINRLIDELGRMIGGWIKIDNEKRARS